MIAIVMMAWLDVESLSQSLSRSFLRSHAVQTLVGITT